MLADGLAKVLRYVFVLLAGFVVVRGFLWLRKDTKQYKKLMRRLPDAGLIGEVLCPATGKKAQLPREGSMGRFTSCDVKLKGNGVRGVHAHFLFVPGKGLKITPRAGKKVQVNGRTVRGSAMLTGGSELILGQERFIVRFFKGLDAPVRSQTEDDLSWQNAADGMPEPEYFVPPGYEPMPGRAEERAYFPAPFDAPVPEGFDDEIPEGWGEETQAAPPVARRPEDPGANAPRQRNIPRGGNDDYDTEWGPD